MYLNVYVPQLQHAGGLVGYVHRQLGLVKRVGLLHSRARSNAQICRVANIAWDGPILPVTRPTP
jgi:hypothetical protein